VEGERRSVPSFVHARREATQTSPRTAAIGSGLRLSQPGDHLEREADDIADRIMRSADPVSVSRAPLGISRACASCEEEPRVMRSAASAHAPHVAPNVAAGVPRSGGAPLPAEARAFFEPRLGHDLARVRIHADASAAQSARALQARAYTLGDHVVFDSGKYAPDTTAGRRLLAHELTHVVQQRQTGTAQIQRDVEGGVKIKGDFKMFTPTISGTVGGDEGSAVDIETVQILLADQGYSVSATGKMDEATRDAIVAFQKKAFPKWAKHDGKIEPGGKTWKKLTKGYYEPDEADRERKQFGPRRNVAIGPADITAAKKDTLAFVEDKNNDKLDDALARDRAAADAAVGNVDHIKAKNVRHVAAILETYYDLGISVDTLYVLSHGSYKKPRFVLGNETIDQTNVKRLKILRTLLAPDTKLVVTACHVGGGKDEAASRAFTQDIAQALDVTVYTSRSWVAGSEDAFTEGKVASAIDKPKDFDAADMKDRPNIYLFLGEWLKATPGEKEATIEEINSPVYDADGGFSISSRRFPGYSVGEVREYLQAIRKLLKK
jgi:hypothetical protein